MTKQDVNKDDLSQFSLVLGGPLYQFYLRTFLAKSPLHLYKRRILCVTLFTWLPLFIFSMIAGLAFKGVKVPFFYDIEIHLRFLVALALFIAAEPIVHQAIRVMIQQFYERNIIALHDHPKFNHIILQAMRLRNSITAEVILILIVITIGHWIWRNYMSINLATWYAFPIMGRMHLTLAGYWYTFISIPIFQFILLRWYFRLFIWYRFLWQVSRLPLRLNSLHPDRAGGLSFLSNSVFAFSPILIAHMVVIVGLIANRIFYAGATLTEFRFELISITIYLILLVLIPLFFFIIPLIKTKTIGTYTYGSIASRYVNDFRNKWIERPIEKDKEILGTADIQSLGDLSNSYLVTQEMRIFPFTGKTLFQLMILIAFPILPLMISLIPFDEIAKFSIKLLI